jgi:hypothetical protein
MGYGFTFNSKTKLTKLAREYAPSNPNTEYELAVALDAYEQHKLAEDRFLEFLRNNNEKDNQ